MPKNKAREFGTIEQALLYAVQQLEGDEIQRAKRGKGGYSKILRSLKAR